jgi:hypothetical protein
MRMIVEDFYTYRGTMNSAMLSILDFGETENIRRDDMYHGVNHVANLHSICSSQDARDIDIYSFDDESRLVYMRMNTRYRDPESKDGETYVKYELTFCNASRKHSSDVVGAILKGHDKGSEKVLISISFVETFAISDEEVLDSVGFWMNAKYDFDNEEVVFGCSDDEINSESCKNNGTLF